MIPRNLALQALNRASYSTGFPGAYLEQAFQRYPHLNERDRAFVIHLVQGVLRWRLRLDWCIEQAVRFPFRQIEPPVLNILRVALYQIFFMDRVPESAAVNEAVKQARNVSRSHVAGVVNGILRHICRQKDQLVFPDRKSDPVGYLSLFYSYPAWLVELWIRELGIDTAENLLKAGNGIPEFAVRANSLKIKREDLISRLKEEKVDGKPTLHSPDGLTIKGAIGSVNDLKAFKDGLFQVQGEAAQVCSHLVFPRSGDAVLDLCAGLGGKSTHLAALMGDKGLVIALDINRSRLVKLDESSRRLGIDCIQPIVADAGLYFPSLFRYSFDRILIDGPCSGLGTISRHPDIKWTRQEKDINRLCILQKRILFGAVDLLRRGGKLLYVTCTISRDENEGNVHALLERSDEMVLENLKGHVPAWCSDLIDDQGFLKSYPHMHKMDGFFGALFTKK